MNTQLRQIIYTLERQFGKYIEIRKYEPVDIDYSDPKFSPSFDTMRIKAVPLPRQSKILSFQPLAGDYELFDRIFLIKINTLKFPLAVQYTFIIFDNQRYDIKKLETLEGVYYLASCISAGVEPHE